jgi:hypothetical protein
MLIIEPGDTLYKTRAGWKVVVYAIYPGQMYCIVGAVFRDGVWNPAAWIKGGRKNHTGKSHMDIVGYWDEEEKSLFS